MNFLDKILQEKAREVAQLPDEVLQEFRPRASFYETVKNKPERMHLIGEIKRASPSKGDIQPTIDILEQSQKYQAAKVSAISVLTDTVFFKGSIDDLHAISQVVAVPILCKDFIISKKQLIRARNSGASIVLLIVAALSLEQLYELYAEATKLGLEVLVETHDAKELAIAEQLGAKIIGVNNRNLKTFDVTLETSVALAPSKQDVVYISESGFKTAADVAKVAKNYQAVLVGETLMRAENPAQVAERLQVQRL
jgi:indole-3-glycerol phosphate synthase